MIEEEKPQDFQVYVEDIPCKKYDVYLNKAIEDPSQMELINHTVRTAGSNDVVYLHVNTIGGNLSAAIEFCNAIEQSAATVIGFLEAEACSAGSMIFLACDDWHVPDLSTLMVHNLSSGFYGKGHEIISQTDYLKELSKRVLNKFYTGFLTEDEVTLVSEGKDLYMFAEEIKSRLKNLWEYRQSLKESPEDNYTIAGEHPLTEEPTKH